MSTRTRMPYKSLHAGILIGLLVAVQTVSFGQETGGDLDDRQVPTSPDTFRSNVKDNNSATPAVNSQVAQRERSIATDEPPLEVVAQRDNRSQPQKDPGRHRRNDRKNAENGKPKTVNPNQNAEAPTTPLGKFFRKLFSEPNSNRSRPAVPSKEQDEADVNTGPKFRDQIDALAPYDSERTDWLRKASVWMKQEQWLKAMERLQFLLDQPQDSVVLTPEGEWVSVHAEANRLLGEFPPRLLQEHYHRRYGGLARRQFDEALRKGDLERIADVATRMFHTSAGYDAANHLAALHFDRGDFGMAAYWFKRLLEAPADGITGEPHWQLKAALALREAGKASESGELLQRLTSRQDWALLKLGDQSIQPQRWLETTEPAGVSRPISLEDWPMLLGSPHRMATSRGGDPLLLQRWSHTSTSLGSVQEQIDLLVRELRDQGRAPIPAGFPLTVDGKVVFSTLRGLRVVDAANGRDLWETREEFSLERLIQGRIPRVRGRGRVVWQFGNSGTMSLRRGGEHGVLANLLFRNGLNGILSSDGRQLFVIEDHGIVSGAQGRGMWARAQRPSADPMQRDLASNKLVSYDLETGRPHWEIGGTAVEETFDLPLAGTYFLGAPVPVGEELFVVGEQDGDIRVHALDAQTGKPLWSQLIGSADPRIDQDSARRWWTAQVAVGGGLLICPTTVGWLVAVDRLNHSILWAHRYSKPKRDNRGNYRQRRLTPTASLNSRWCPSAPVIVNNRVVYTPPEQSTLVCLNISDGSVAWERRKGDFLYLAGVFEDRVVLVGMEEIVGLSLDNGRPLWNVSFPKDAGPPSGVGVAVGERYHLPLESRQLLTIDWRQGELVEVAHLPADHPALGNLAMYRGMLIALGPQGLTSFEQRQAVEAEIAGRKADDPNNPQALLREADIAMLQRDYAAALKFLQRIDPDRLVADSRPAYRKALLKSLESEIRSDLQTHDQEMDRLKQLVQTSQEKLNYQRLAAERWIARGDSLAAFEIYWKLTEQDGSQLIPYDRNPDIQIRLDLWLAGKMADLWLQTPDHPRARLDERIESAAQDAIGRQDTARVESLAELFHFHPVAVSLKRNLVDVYAASGDLHRAENLLRQLSLHSDESVAAAALFQLGQLLRHSGWPRDAAHYENRLRTQFADVPIEGAMTAGELLEELQDSEQGDVRNPRIPNWGRERLRVIRGGVDHSLSSIQHLKCDGNNPPFFRDYRLQIDSEQQRLTIISAQDESLYWTVPLRTRSNSLQSAEAAIQTSGHQLIVLHRGVIHCLSPLERRVVWTRPLEADGHAATYYRQPSEEDVKPMRAGTDIVAQSGVAHTAGSDGMLAVSNSQYVCYYGRRQFTVVDAATGEVRWTGENLSQGTRVCGNEEILYVIPKDTDQAVALRALDGRRLEIPNLGSLLRKTLQLSGRNFVLLENDGDRGLFGLKQPDAIVRLFDPLDRKTLWAAEYPGNSHFALVESRSLAVRKPDGAIDWLDLSDGRRHQLEAVASSERTRVREQFVVADEENIYWIANRSRRGGHFSESLPSVRVNGTIVAWNRHTGQKVWRHNVFGQNLILPHLQYSPVLVFAVRRYQRKGDLGFTTSHITALDKHTGRELVDITLPSNSGGIRSMELDLSERRIELCSYGDRIRLMVVGQQESPSPPTTAAPGEPVPASQGAEPIE